MKAEYTRFINQDAGQNSRKGDGQHQISFYRMGCEHLHRLINTPRTLAFGKCAASR